MIVTWWSKNKVLVVGAIGAIIMAASAFASQETIVWPQVVMAVVVALGSFLAKNLRGQVASMAGIVIAVVIGVLPDMISHKQIDWEHQLLFILGQIGALFFGAVTPPAKSIGYERTPVIEAAKEKGEQITENQVVVKKDSAVK